MKKQLLRLLHWRQALVYTHRWLGIAGCLLFVGWFFSGIVMMYARMPTLASEERLARATALDLSSVTLTPAEAAKIAGAAGTNVQVAMFRERPAYRFGPGGGRNGRGARGQIVFADTGEVVTTVSLDEAREAARRFEPQYTGTLEYDGYVTEPDQWTLQARAAMPMHRFALDDAAGTRLYVSEANGEVVLRTTRRERFWGYLGPVIHWVYFTPLRQNSSAWNEFIVWSSLIGCFMCITGLVWGLLRFSPSARFRLKRQAAYSPYAGMMKWHHYAGLFFGVITLTWTYSGLLSMGPFDWFRPVGGGGGRARQQQRGGGAKREGLETISLDRLRAAHAAMSEAFPVKSLEISSVQGQLYWTADRPPTLAEADQWRSPSLMPRTPRPALERRYVSVAQPDEGSFTTFSKASMVEVAEATMPDVPVQDSTWLDSYDDYYYDSRAGRSLPVLRVRYADPQQTWLYLDPASGGVVSRMEKTTRLKRWLYHGLHSLDFPFLYYKRPLWDIVVILLSIGGLVLSATTMLPAWRRLVRHGRRAAAVVTRRRPARRPSLVGAPVEDTRTS